MSHSNLRLVTASATLDLETLYRQYGHVVLRRARRILGSDVDAQEVVQELFANLVENPRSMARARSVVAWLYGATTHLCLNRLRNQRTRARLLDAVSRPAVAEPAAERAAMASHLLTRMPALLGQVMVYLHVDELTYEETAELLDCSPRQVGHLIHRARSWLRDLEGRDEVQLRAHASCPTR